MTTTTTIEEHKKLRTWAERSDKIRTGGLFGEGYDSVLILTPGIQEKGKDFAVSAILRMMGWRTEWFDADHDPDGKREMAAFDHFGEKIFFKVEPMPGNPDARTITIGILSEL